LAGTVASTRDALPDDDDLLLERAHFCNDVALDLECSFVSDSIPRLRFRKRLKSLSSNGSVTVAGQSGNVPPLLSTRRPCRAPTNQSPPNRGSNGDDAPAAATLAGHIAKDLYREPGMRAVAVGMASAIAKDTVTAAAAKGAMAKLDSLGQPLGPTIRFAGAWPSKQEAKAILDRVVHDVGCGVGSRTEHVGVRTSQCGDPVRVGVDVPMGTRTFSPLASNARD